MTAEDRRPGEHQNRESLPETYEAYKPTDEEFLAVFEQAIARTRAVAVGDQVGSAVPVRLGDRYLLATAAHLLEANQVPEIIRKPGSPCIPMKYRHLARDAEADVALLELAPEQWRHIGVFAEAPQLVTVLTHDIPADVVIVGSPADTIQAISRHLRGHVITSFHTFIVPRDRWPTNLDRPARRDRDMFLEYADTTLASVVDSRHPVPGAAKLRPSPKPYGFSGGGIWVVASRQDRRSRIWSPDAKLIGLQNAWLRGPGLVRGTLIEYWLRLVEQEYPDLAGVLTSIRERAIALKLRDPE